MVSEGGVIKCSAFDASTWSRLNEMQYLIGETPCVISYFFEHASINIHRPSSL